MARNVLTELKIPAERDFIGVAKAVGSRLGGRFGFSLEELDELAIAVAQACETAVETGRRAWGEGGSLKLTFSATGRGLAVDVQAIGPRSEAALPTPARAERLRQEELQQLTDDMIRCFVDDFRSQVDGRGVRFRMVKYLIG